MHQTLISYRGRSCWLRTDARWRRRHDGCFSPFGYVVPSSSNWKSDLQSKSLLKSLSWLLKRQKNKSMNLMWTWSWHVYNRCTHCACAHNRKYFFNYWRRAYVCLPATLILGVMIEWATAVCKNKCMTSSELIWCTFSLYSLWMCGLSSTCHLTEIGGTSPSLSLTVRCWRRSWHSGLSWRGWRTAPTTHPRHVRGHSGAWLATHI